MTADLEARIREELGDMAARVEPATESWAAIRRRAARHRARRSLQAVAAATVLAVFAAATTRPWEADDPAIETGHPWLVGDLHVRDQVQVGSGGAFFVRSGLMVSLVAEGGAVWFTRAGSSQIHHLDPVSASVVAVADTQVPLVNLTLSPDAVWAVAEGYGEVVRLDRETEEVARVSLEVGGVDHATTGGIAYLDRAVWVAVAGGRLVRIDLESGAVEAVDVGVDVRLVTVGEGVLWGVGEAGGVFRLDPRLRRVTDRADLGDGRFRIEHGEGAVWVLDTVHAELVELTPDLASSRRIEVGPTPADLAVGAGAVWVTDRFDGELLVVDPASGEPRTALRLGGRPGDLVVAGDEIWISDNDAGTLASVALR